jgi:hypothetical protein
LVIDAAPDALDPFRADTPLTLVPLRDEVIGALWDGVALGGEGGQAVGRRLQ